MKIPFEKWIEDNSIPEEAKTDYFSRLREVLLSVLNYEYSDMYRNQ